MRKKNYVSGDTVDAKFESVNKALQSFQLRLRKTIVGVIPPIPIFGYTQNPEEDGTIMRHIIPAPGSISRLCMAIREYNPDHKQTVKFSCGVTRTSGRLFHDFDTKKSLIVEDVSVDVETGDILKIGVEDATYVSGISVSILYHIGVAESAIHNVLIDELERLLEE